jgi:hypothetical protein
MFLLREKTVKQIWSDDKKRITRIKSLTNKPVFIVWEKDLIENGIKNTINKHHYWRFK